MKGEKRRARISSRTMIITNFVRIIKIYHPLVVFLCCDGPLLISWCAHKFWLFRQGVSFQLLSLLVDRERERHSSFVCNISSFLLSSLAVSVLSSSTSDIDTHILATLESKRRRLLPFQFFNLLRRPNEGIEINRRTSPAPPPPSASSSFNLVQRNEETHWWWRWRRKLKY